ncbi:hypothetical protein F0U64_13080 [Achromobacter xylosoxidans]|nr:hypothetical protein F0U64_13080 [Achromobacter xylosoxidans]
MTTWGKSARRSGGARERGALPAGAGPDGQAFGRRPGGARGVGPGFCLHHRAPPATAPGIRGCSTCRIRPDAWSCADGSHRPSSGRCRR